MILLFLLYFRIPYIIIKPFRCLCAAQGAAVISIRNMIKTDETVKLYHGSKAGVRGLIAPGFVRP